MGSRDWKVVYASKVKQFRKTLPPKEAELFDECCKRICLDPYEDKVHKFKISIMHPLESLMYRDDDFVVIYYPSQVTEPSKTRRIDVIKATRTRDLE